MPGTRYPLVVPYAGYPHNLTNQPTNVERPSWPWPDWVMAQQEQVAPRGIQLARSHGVRRSGRQGTKGNRWPTTRLRARWERWPALTESVRAKCIKGGGFGGCEAGGCGCSTGSGAERGVKRFSDSRVRAAWQHGRGGLERKDHAGSCNEKLYYRHIHCNLNIHRKSCINMSMPVESL